MKKQKKGEKEREGEVGREKREGEVRGGGTGLLAAGRSSVRALQLYYWGRPVLWWSVEVVVGALEIVIRN